MPAAPDPNLDAANAACDALYIADKAARQQALPLGTIWMLDTPTAWWASDTTTGASDRSTTALIASHQEDDNSHSAERSDA